MSNVLKPKPAILNYSCLSDAQLPDEQHARAHAAATRFPVFLLGQLGPVWPLP